MEGEMAILAPPAPPLPPNAEVDVPLMPISAAPRSSECELISRLLSALHPLIITLALLYLVPGLFFDPTAQALVEWCQLDVFIDRGF